MGLKELNSKLAKVADEVKKNALDFGSYYSYQDENCTSPDMFVHQYKDGRRELIKIGQTYRGNHSGKNSLKLLCLN